jgi:hypothetical protein
MNNPELQANTVGPLQQRRLPRARNPTLFFAVRNARRPSTLHSWIRILRGDATESGDIGWSPYIYRAQMGFLSPSLRGSYDGLVSAHVIACTHATSLIWPHLCIYSRAEPLLPLHCNNFVTPQTQQSDLLPDS